MQKYQLVVYYKEFKELCKSSWFCPECSFMNVFKFRQKLGDNIFCEKCHKEFILTRIKKSETVFECQLINEN